MKQFFVRFLLVLAFVPAGYTYHAYAQGKDNKEKETQVEPSSQSLYESSDLTQQQQMTSSTTLANKNNGDGSALYAPPSSTNGGKGDPLSGVSPVGPGFSVLIVLSLFYMSCIVFFRSVKKRKMNKTFFVFLILLTASVFQAYGQVPIGSRLIRRIDFGSGTDQTATAANAANILNSLKVETKFTAYGGTASLPANNYLLVQKVYNSTWAYRVWWGYSTLGNGVNATQANSSFLDHTGNTGGYYMVTNTDVDTVSYIMRFSIGGLCPNTHLYFTSYLGNLVISTAGQSGGPGSGTYYDPKLRFAVVDANNLADTLQRYVMPDTVPKCTPAEGPYWRQYGFDFYSKSDSIVLLVYNNQAQTAGNDLAMDDVEIWLSPPEVSASGRQYYCDGENVNLSLNYDAADIDETYGIGNLGFQWLYTQSLDPNIDPLTNDFSAWELAGNGQTCTYEAKVGYYVGLIGTKESIVDNDYSCCSVSDTIPVYFIPPTDTLYWKTNADDQNWNNPKNWLSVLNGMTEPPYAPSVCTSVHIPGNSNKYPSLDAATSVYSCACHNIWFHFGGLIGQPQLLQYDSAYVQYNFGDKDGINRDPISADPMIRGSRWYALAAPLQKMASGDFSFCGYPSMYQERFESVAKTQGEGGYTDLGEGIYAQWFAPENTNSWAIADQYNAIAIWADDDNPDTSMGLDGLNGILEVPYYESPDAAFHRGFSQAGATSFFQYYYYDEPGFPLIDINDPEHPAGSINRGTTGEAYKFLFDGSGIYTLTVAQPGAEIMVGNPFMSNLDFEAFVRDNPDIKSYRLYVYNNLGAYSYTAGSGGGALQYIAPLQAFFITTLPTTTTLTFNAKNEAVADPYDNKLRASTGSGKADVLYFKAESKAGVSWLTLSMQNVKEKNLNLLLPDGYPEVPQIYATDNTGQKNSIQFEGGYVNSVPLGVFSSASDQVTLTVSNKDKVNLTKLTLFDKSLNKSTDLLATDSYTFQNTPSVPDRFTLTMEGKSITGISTKEVEHPAYVGATGNTLFVNAASAIEDVSVITLQGITVSKDSNIGQLSYTKALQLPSGLYLVSVKLKTGSTSVSKVVIK